MSKARLSRRKSRSRLHWDVHAERCEAGTVEGRMSSISVPVDTYVGGGAWRGSWIRSTGVGAVGQQQVSVTLDVQERVCCMQCVVRSVDVQPAVAKASTMMSVMLETCVARPLMDMTTRGRARVMPAIRSQENRNKRQLRGGTVRISSRRAEFPALERSADRCVGTVVGRCRQAAPGPARPEGRAPQKIVSGVRLQIEEMNDGAQRLRRRGVHERL